MKSATRFSALRAAAASALLVAACLVTALLAGAPVAQAATINLTPPNNSGDPDLQSWQGSLNYTYTAVCKKSSGTQTGVCGGSYTVPQWNLTYGKLTYTSTVLSLKAPSNSAPVNVINDNYSLTVILGFNATGTAISGILASDPWTGDATYTSNLAALGKLSAADQTTHPGYGVSGNLVSGKPTNATAAPWLKAYNFGYGGTEKAGIFEFVFKNITGDFAPGGCCQSGGIILSTTTLNHPLINVAGIQTWDSQGINFWKNNFSATNVNGDTFVPVPAAVWMFGSAIAGMGFVRRRRQAAPRGQAVA